MSISVFVARVVDDGLGVLLPGEQQRACDIASLRRRREYVSGRLLLRRALQECYGDRASAWVLAARADGALLLKSNDVDELLPAVSLSHSHGHVAVALADSSTVGIDIEFVRPRTHLYDLAQWALHARELARFSALDAQGKLAYFYAKWVIKEAFGKALGLGIHYPMRDCCIEDGRLTAVAPDMGVKPGDWMFQEQQLDSGHCLGLAWQAGVSDHVSINTLEVLL